MFLTVWLKRQELELAKWRVVAQGMADRSKVGEVYSSLISALFPFIKDVKGASDRELIEKMKKEVEKGPISFSPIVANPFKDRMKRMSMPDETMAKLREAVKRRKQ